MPTLTGQYFAWRLGQHCRRFATICLPFVEAAALFKPDVFDAVRDRGEQRKATPGHVRMLRAEIAEGRFTPTAWACTLPKPLQKKVSYDESAFTFSLDVPAKRCLPCTDGGHRREAILAILDEFGEKRKMAQDEATQRHYDDLIAQVEALPVSVEVQLDGNSRVDFLNLNKGKSVARTLVFSLEVATDQYDDPQYVRAATIARLLNEERGSPFIGVVQFDSLWDKPGITPFPSATLCAGGTTDAATSLIGLARVGHEFGMDEKTLCRIVCAAYSALYSGNLDILKAGFPLTPPEHGGKRGSATLLIGTGVVLAYAMGVAGLTIPSEGMLRRLVDAATFAMGERTNGDLGGPRKRLLMGEFTQEFFRDDDLYKYEGIPVGLCRVLGAGSFARKKLPKSYMEDSPPASQKEDAEPAEDAA